MIKNRHLTDTTTSEKGVALGFNKAPFQINGGQKKDLGGYI